jgi:hypothetical protein
MSKSTVRSNIAAGRVLGYAACGFVTPAFAAISLSAQQWPTYLLYGSIALLVAGAVGKMLTYASGDSAPLPANSPRSLGIGMYRNSVLSPGE